MSRFAKSSTMVLSRTSRSLYFLLLAGGPWAQSTFFSTICALTAPGNPTVASDMIFAGVDISLAFAARSLTTVSTLAI